MGRDKALSALRKAVKKGTVSVQFEMEYGGEKLQLTMKNPDLLQMSNIQELARASELAVANAKGLDKLAVDEKKWQEFKKQSVEKITDRNKKAVALKELDREKPSNRAEQHAKEAAWMATAKEFIPTILYVDDELLFASHEDLLLYDELIHHLPTFTLLMSKFAELITLSNAVGEAVKNSPASSMMN